MGILTVLIVGACTRDSAPQADTGRSALDSLMISAREARQRGEPHDLETALNLYRKASLLAAESGQGWLYSSSLNELGATHFRIGSPDSALSYFHLARTASDSVGHAYNAGTARINIAQVHKSFGNRDSALVYLREAEQIFESSPENQQNMLKQIRALLAEVGAE